MPAQSSVSAAIDAAEPEPDKLDPRVWKIASVVLLGPLLTNLDSTVVNVSLSNLSHDLASPLDTIQWVTSGYLLSLALILPLSGWLVDRIGARRVYLWCFAFFTLTSMLCGAARSAPQLIAFRVLQGACGGLLTPMAQMMAARIAGRQVAKVMSFIATPVMLGPILGPALAGFILQSASWRWIFFINLPIGVLATILAWKILPSDADERKPRSFDLIGFALLSPALVMIMHSLDRLGTDDQAGVFSWLELALGTALLLAFLAYGAKRGKAALVDVNLFRKLSFTSSAFTQFFNNAVVFGGQMILPLYLLMVKGMSPSNAGIILAPAGVGMLCAYPLMGRLTGRFGPRKVSASGALIALLGTLPFAFVPIAQFPTPLFCALLFVRGAGLGSINIPSIAAAYTAIPKENIPVATTAINIVQRLGGPVATTALAIFLHLRMVGARDDGSDAFLATMRFLTVIHVLPILSALLLPAKVAVRSTMVAPAAASAVGE